MLDMANPDNLHGKAGLSPTQPTQPAQRVHPLQEDAQQQQKQDRTIPMKPAHMDECTICLQPITDRAIAYPCNHLSFDFICLTSWLQDHPTCPLCKATVVSVQYDWRDVHDFETYHVPPQPSSSSSSSGYLSHNTSTIPQSPHDNQSHRHQPRQWPFPTSARSQNPQHRPRHRPRPKPQIYSKSLSPPAIARRKFVYEHNLYSLHVGSNIYSKYKEYTPPEFSKSAQLQTKARTWIRREFEALGVGVAGNGDVSRATDSPPDAQTVQPLQGRYSDRIRNTAVSTPHHQTNREFLLTTLLSLQQTTSLNSASNTIQQLLHPVLGERHTSIFCHDLHNWLKSPYTELCNWDRNVRYKIPLPFTRDEIVEDAEKVPWGGWQGRKRRS